METMVRKKTDVNNWRRERTIEARVCDADLHFVGRLSTGYAWGGRHMETMVREKQMEILTSRQIEGRVLDLHSLTFDRRYVGCSCEVRHMEAR